MSFADIEDTMCKEEMKCIMGGSGGGGGAGMSSNNTNGSLTYGGSNPPAYSGPGGYYGNTEGWDLGFVTPGSGGSTSSGGSGSSSPMIITTGWLPTDIGIKTTDPVSISRYIDFINLNNGVVTSSQVATFIMNEGSLAGQRENSIQLYGTVLNNVTVYNNYKGPSTIAPGVVYNNGVLDIYSSAYGAGSGGSGGILAGSTYVTSASSTPTSAKLIDFTRDDIFYGFMKIDFSKMLYSSTITFDPIKNQFDYNKTFQPTMKLNADGAIAIAQYESLSLTVYDKDSNTGQNTTIGFGHLLHYGAIKVGDIQSITMDQAVSYLAKDIVVAQNTLNQKIENSGLTGQFNRSQYLALVDMTFNGGNIVDNILSAMKSGGVKAANSAFTNSYLNETNGGLKDRRYFEAQAFINGRSLTPEQANAELVSLGLKK